MKDRLIFFGTEDFSLPSLEGLLKKGYDVVAAVTKPDRPHGRGRKLRAPAIKEAAETAGLPVLQPEKLTEIISDIRKLRPAAGVVVAYGKILPISILELFPKGLINVHASLLPRYRGPSPIEAAILKGDDKTGATIMEIAPAMDAGPIYKQTEIALHGKETKPELYDRLSRLGADLLADNLSGILAQELEAVPQDEDAATYVPLLKKSDGIIDWQRPAVEIERQVRAYLGWPGSRGYVLGSDITITEAEIIEAKGPAGKVFVTESGELAVFCGKGALQLNRLIPAGKREMSGRQYLAGRQNYLETE